MTSIQAKVITRLGSSIKSQFIDPGLDTYGMLKQIRKKTKKKGWPNWPLTRRIIQNETKLSNSTVTWIGNNSSNKVVFFVHGGGYVLGLNGAHKLLAHKIGKMSGSRVLIVEYRLAPEHPFPAAIEDVTEAYEYLLSHVSSPTDIVLVGESAGAGLCLSLLGRIKKAKKKMPQGAVLMSPLLDLTFSGASIISHADRDPFLHPNMLNAVAKFYCGSQTASNTEISPLFGDLAGYPPLLVQVGSEEILFDDATRLVQLSKKQGVSAELEVWPGMFHSFQTMVSILPEAKQALNSAVKKIHVWYNPSQSEN